jgi:hypothetical protein
MIGSLEKMVLFPQVQRGMEGVFVNAGTIEKASEIAYKWVAQGCPLGEGLAESFPEITRFLKERKF